MQPSPLFKEIVIVLLVKVVLLAGLWAAFFSDPVDDGLTPERVGRTLVGPPEAESHEIERGDADGR